MFGLAILILLNQYAGTCGMQGAKLLNMYKFKILYLILLALFSAVISFAQAENEEENSDEPKILRAQKSFNYINRSVKKLKIPNRKHDTPFYCNEFIPFKNGFIINSIATFPAVNTTDVISDSYYFNPADRSLKRILVQKTDTIESINCSNNTLYYSIIKNGKRVLGQLKDQHYENLLESIAPGIRHQIDTAKWIKLGIDQEQLVVLGPDFAGKFTPNGWVQLTSYSIDDFYTNKLGYRRSISMLPSKNLVINNNTIYFLQEIIEQRACMLLMLNLENGTIQEYFSSIDLTDKYFKQINDFTFLEDGSLLVTASRLIQRYLVINTKENNIAVWIYKNGIRGMDGLRANLPVTTVLNLGDSLFLASPKGLYAKKDNTVTPLVYFDNVHQTIKDKKIGAIDYLFEPRSIQKTADNNFIIGGLWGGLYQVDLIKNKITCLDDIAYDKIKTIELNEL